MFGLTDEQLNELRALPGLVATVALTGSVTPEFSASLAEMRSFNDRNGFHKIEYQQFHAVLVESGRDAAVAHMMNTDKGAYQWLLQIDADAAPFRPDAVPYMLFTMWHKIPSAAALGGYCQLKGAPYLPTIDTGTGTWEEHYPGEGLLAVIRTGAHFLMCRRHAFTKTGPPWFRTRLAQQPIRAMMEVDNYARRTLGGDNPLIAMPEWDTMLHAALRDGLQGETAVGEDSGFFDKLRGVMQTAYVDTDLVVGHKAHRTIMPNDFIDAIRDQAAAQAACLGMFR